MSAKIHYGRWPGAENASACGLHKWSIRYAINGLRVTRCNAKVQCESCKRTALFKAARKL